LRDFRQPTTAFGANEPAVIIERGAGSQCREFFAGEEAACTPSGAIVVWAGSGRLESNDG
jgi:hypothetical protein